MTMEVSCTNPTCRRRSRLGSDSLGRTFRCARCGTKLPGPGGAVALAGVNFPAAADRPAPRGSASAPVLTAVAPARLPAAVEESWDEDEGDAAASSAGGSASTSSRPRRSLGLAMPARVGRFQVRALLGSGSCGTVYRAFDPDLEREVALKVPHPGSVNGPKALARFCGEAKALARLRHPAVVPLFEAGSDGGVPYLATAYIAARTLGQVLDAGRLEAARAARIALALAEALAYAHERGVVHRDVKPANVLVEPGGAVHLADFGLAHRDDAAKLTRPGSLIGTPAYVAPEQADGSGAVARPANDQYSLGVVLYEMLCGRTPYEGPPPLVLHNARLGSPTPPRALRPGLPRELERICLRAMALRPADRYADCAALADDLRRWLDGRPAPAHGAPRPVDRAVRWLRQRPAVALTGLLGALGLAASTVLAAAMVAPAPAAAAPRAAAPPAAGPTPIPTASAVAAEPRIRVAGRFGLTPHRLRAY